MPIASLDYFSLTVHELAEQSLQNQQREGIKKPFLDSERHRIFDPFFLFAQQE